jgi:uncharacterized C2H2 Zn-finger protein
MPCEGCEKKEKKEFKCPKCGMNFETKDKLMEHKKETHM